jgi:carboxyl-terminal processing protease
MRLRSWLPLLLVLPLSAVLAQEAPPTPTPAPTTAPADVQPPPAANDEIPASDDPDAVETAQAKVPLEEIRRFVGVFNAVREAYVDPVDDRKLMQSAIKGLLLDLDPHSAYLEKNDAQAFDEETSGAYAGIGVEVQVQDDGTIKIIAPIDDTPAARAGLKSGDVITAVDGKAVASDDDADSQGPLRGPAGSLLTLTIEREGMAKPFDVTLKRETIRVASVRSRMLEPGLGYIRIAAFQADTAADFERQLAALQAQARRPGTAAEAAGAKPAGAGKPAGETTADADSARIATNNDAGPAGGGNAGLRGLVLDLRSNPGGLLTSSVQIADDLLDRGHIVSTRGRIAVSDSQFNATPGDRMHGAPIVALVDAGSASAAEVLAGALADNHRARIVGSRTFGKGSVQTLLPLDNGDSVKLTTARYYTPSGKSIQARGIAPDVVLHPAAGAANGGHADYTEATLPGHLHGEDEGDAGSHAGDVLDGDAPIAAALAELKKMLAPTASAGQAAASTPATPGR